MALQELTVRTLDVKEVLNRLDASASKPIEVMLVGVNLPVDEEGCVLAGRILRESSLDRIEDAAAAALAARWAAKFPQIALSLEEVRKRASEEHPKKWWTQILTSLATVAVLYAWVSVRDRIFRYTLGAVGVLVVLGAILFFIIDWQLTARRSKRQRSEARRALLDAIRSAVNSELRAGLPGFASSISYGDWLIRYPIETGSSDFEEFTRNPQANLAGLLQKSFPGEVAQVHQSFQLMIRSRIIAGDWSESKLSSKRAALIPLGSDENFRSLGIAAEGLELKSVQILPQNVYNSPFRLCCVYVVTRSPVRWDDIGAERLYRKVLEASPPEEISRRDPAPELGKLKLP